MDETTGWQPDGMRNLAGTLVDVSRALQHRGIEASSVLAAVDRWLPTERELGRVAAWAESEAISISARAEALEIADRSIRAALTGDLTIEIRVDAVMTTSQHIDRLRGWLETTRSGGVPRLAVAEMERELDTLVVRRILEIGLVSRVDPDGDWSDELADLVAELRLSPTIVEDLADAAARGMGPDEVAIPAALFAPDYVDSFDATIAPLRREVRRLEGRVASRLRRLEEIDRAVAAGDGVDEIFERFGEVPFGIDVTLLDHRIELEDARGELAAARRELSRDHLDTAAWILTMPIPDGLIADSAGRVLAGAIERDPAALGRVAGILDAVVSPELDRAFFDALGVEAASMLPTWIAGEAWADPDAARARVRSFSEALGRATREGLGFRAVDLVWPEHGRWMVPPAELLRVGEFPNDFLAEAASTLIAV